jgi:hypothetical protein
MQDLHFLQILVESFIFVLQSTNGPNLSKPKTFIDMLLMFSNNIFLNDHDVHKWESWIFFILM